MNPQRLMVGNALSLLGLAFSLGAANPPLTPGAWTDISPAWMAGAGSFGVGLALDPSNPSTVYLCTGNFNPVQDGVYKSTDGGSTWKRMGKLDQPIRVRVDPKDPKHLYSVDGVRGNSMGFWISTDGGENWAKPAGWTALPESNHNFFIDDCYDISVDPADFKHILISSHSVWGTARPDYWNGGAGILESKDGGGTWIVHNPPPNMAAGHGIWFLNDRATWLWGTQDKGYWRTADSGAHWTQVTTMNMAHGGGTIYYTKAGILYASCADGIMRSPDNGVTWKKAGPTTFCNAVGGDGTYIYAHQAYNGANEPYARTLETDGLTWEVYAAGGSFGNGPFEMAYDKVNGILYSSCWGTGILALKTGSTRLGKPPEARAQSRARWAGPGVWANGRAAGAAVIRPPRAVNPIFSIPIGEGRVPLRAPR